MAELILTEEEKEKSWAHLDNGSLGRCIKTILNDLNNLRSNTVVSEEFAMIADIAAAISLVAQSHISNAETTNYTLEGVTIRREEIGDYIITVTMDLS